MAHVVLVGFMGTGKTTIGRILAARLGYPFVDSDRKLESQEGKSISEIFEQAGEEVFRGKEKEMMLSPWDVEIVRRSATGEAAQ